MKKMLVILLLPLTLGATVPTPVAWWKMDAVVDGVVADASGQGRNLTVGDGCSLVTGLSGTALRFDGSSSAYGSFSDLESHSGSRTVSLWMRRSESDGTTGTAYFLRGFGPVMLRMTKSSGACIPLVDDSSKFESAYFGERERWQHLVLVEKVVPSQTAGKVDCRVDFYVNGGLAATKTLAVDADKFVATGGSGTLGNYSPNSSYPFCGDVEDVRMFDQALTYGQVREEYARYEPEIPRLIARWKMNAIATDDDGKPYCADELGQVRLSLSGGCSLTNGPSVAGQRALWFDGKQGTAAKFTMPNGVRGYTFSGWVYHPVELASGQLSGNTMPRLFAVGSTTYAYLYETTTASDYLRLNCKVGGTDDKSFADVKPATTGRGEWAHFAYAVQIEPNADGDAEAFVEWYLNGEKIGSSERKSVAGKNDVGAAVEWFVGGNGSNRPFFGGLCDVRFYDRALTAGQVRQVFAGPVGVSAGADFTTTGSSAVLLGTFDSATAVADLVGTEPDVAWTVISSPEGGSAEILKPNSLVCPVRLSVPGQYVFRLASFVAGIDVSDEVVVTRDDTWTRPVCQVSVSGPSSVALPSVLRLSASTDPAEPTSRLAWRKKSGPGAVWFSPTDGKSTTAVFSAPGQYVLSCVAVDSADAEDDLLVTVTGSDASYPTDGLAYYWNFDAGPYERMTRTALAFNNAVLTNAALRGMGPRAIGDFAQVDTTIKLPAPDAFAFSLWLNLDETVVSEKETKYGHVFDGGSFYIQCNSYAAKTNDTALSVSLYDQSNKRYSWSFYPSRILDKRPLQGRWASLSFSMDQTDFTGSVDEFCARMKIVFDGVQLSNSELSFNPKDVTNELGQVEFRRRSSNSQSARILGETTMTSKRFFPGVVDEVRYYTNGLTVAQLQRLAQELCPNNRSPQIDILAPETEVQNVSRGESLLLNAVVSDDGLPEGGVLTAGWELEEGDADGIDLPASLSGEARFTRKGFYRLRVRASDGERQIVSSPVSVTVRPSGMILIFR